MWIIKGYIYLISLEGYFLFSYKEYELNERERKGYLEIYKYIFSDEGKFK